MVSIKRKAADCLFSLCASFACTLPLWQTSSLIIFQRCKGLTLPYKWSSLWHQPPHQLTDHRVTAQLIWPLQCPQSTSQGGFCVLTLFILALIKMWWGGFLSPGLGGYCGGEIGDCGAPPWAAHKKLPHPLPLLAIHPIWVLQSHPVAELRLTAAVGW